MTPLLAYTYVGPGHAGMSYKAAGWQRRVDATSGKPPSATGKGVQRRVWMKPLASAWQEALCQEPRRVMGQIGERGDGKSDWARLAGFILKGRQPLPGTGKLW